LSGYARLHFEKERWVLTVSARLNGEYRTAAKRSGTSLAERLREVALRKPRNCTADPVELLLAEAVGIRYML